MAERPVFDYAIRRAEWTDLSGCYVATDECGVVVGLPGSGRRVRLPPGQARALGRNLVAAAGSFDGEVDGGAGGVGRFGPP